MPRRRLAFFLAALTFATSLTAEEKKGPKASLQVVQLHVSRKPPTDRFGPRGTDSVGVEFLVRIPGKHPLRVDDTSKVTVFGDERGNSLKSVNTRFRRSVRVSKTLQSIIVSVFEYTRVPPGATRLVLAGNLVLVCGTDQKTTPETAVEFKEKSETKVGDLVFRVTKAKGFGVKGPEIMVTGKFADIKTLTIKGNDGKEAVAYTSGSRWEPNGAYTRAYSLKDPIEQGKVKVTYFAREEKVTVPTDLSIGVGLSSDSAGGARPKDAEKPARKSQAPTMLSIQRKLDEAEFGPGGRDSILVYFAADVPGKKVIRLDYKGNKVKTFADDEGNSVMTEPKGTDRTNFGEFPQVAKDGASIITYVYAHGRLPAKGARRLHLGGEMLALAGADEKTTGETKVEFKAKSQTKVGDLVLIVDQEKYGDGGPSFELKGQVAAFKSVIVTGESGKETIEGLTRWMDHRDGTRSYYFVLKKPVKAGTVVLNYYAKEERVPVPVDLTFGVGF